MPRESVKAQEHGSAAMVGWAPDDGNVQLGLTWVHDSPAGPDPRSQWVALDRGGVNRLIRHLRRARDAAFGRDE